MPQALPSLTPSESEVSVEIEDCIRSLAQKHLDVRFIKLHFEDAEMEPAGVPALLAYRAGDKFAGLVPIIQEIPDDAELSANTLEFVLKRYHNTLGIRSVLTIANHRTPDIKSYDNDTAHYYIEISRVFSCFSSSRPCFSLFRYPLARSCSMRSCSLRWPLLLPARHATT